MAIVAGVCDSFFAELLAMTPHRATDDYYLALYQPSATLSRSTTAYTTAGEVANSGDYVAGGQLLVGFTAGLTGHVSWLDWTTNPTWTGVTFTTSGALIYNATRAKKAVAVLEFGEHKTPAGVPFTVALPAPGSDASIHISNT